VILDEKKELEAEYDILIFWNFPEGLGLKVKAGEFSSYAPCGQELSSYDRMCHRNYRGGFLSNHNSSNYM
jgi:hypothetical protein